MIEKETLEPEAPSEPLSIEESITKAYESVVEKETAPKSETDKPIEEPEEKPEAGKETLEAAPAEDGKAATEKPADPVKAEYAQIESALAPMTSRLQQNGVSKAEYVKNLVAADQLLQRDPVRGLTEIAALYGINLASLLQPQQTPAKQEPQKKLDENYLDPAIQPLASKIEKLERAQQEEALRRRQIEQEKLVSEVNQFAGKQKHWSKLEQEIIPLVAAYKRANPRASNNEILSKAYETACYQNPEIRAILLSEERAKQVQQTNAKSQAAKRAGASVTGSPSGKVQSSLDGRSIEEIMSKLYDESVTGRVQ